MTSDRPARPVLKWAGGKKQLVPAILKRLPAEIDTYYEPFVGGGAVFFALAARQGFRRARLSDRNPELVTVYHALQQDVEGLIAALRQYRYDETLYYRVRERVPASPIARAARTIFLNKAGYNGLYRVNRSGTFNVPFGRHKNPKICDEENLRAAARALKKATIVEADFEQACRRATVRDAIYFDPPYVPLSETARFVDYDQHPFGTCEQERLAALLTTLGRRGVFALLSNSDTATTRRLYDGHEVARVKARRSINSEPSRRGPIGELLVSNEPHFPKRRATARGA